MIYTINHCKINSGWFSDSLGSHGVAHSIRVAILTESIFNLLGNPLTNQLFKELQWAALLHDIGRGKDYEDLGHGIRSAEWIRKCKDLFTNCSWENVSRLIELADKDDKQIPKKELTLSVRILKDADVLDRWRFTHGPELSFLRTQEARSIFIPSKYFVRESEVLIKSGKDILEAVNISKRFIFNNGYGRNLKEITQVIYDPYSRNGKNLGESDSLFFHGTTKNVLAVVKKEGFVTNSQRPTFSLSPDYSLAYCRKSESYLRGLIRIGNKKEIDKEIKLLLKKRVIKKDDLKDEKYQWWISKADKYYQETIDVTKEGAMLLFVPSIGQMITPDMARMYIGDYGDKKAIFGPPSFWRTRQFGLEGYPGQEINLSGVSFVSINLTKKFVKSLKELSSCVKKGNLSNEMYKGLRLSLENSIDVLDMNRIFKKRRVCDSLVDQTIESAVIRNFRTIYVGKLRLRGMKVYCDNGKELIEDPRWQLTESEIKEEIVRLKENNYLKPVWLEYVQECISDIERL